MLSLYRAGLRLRRAAPWGAGAFAWLPSGTEVLAFTRGEDFTCLVNFGSEPAALPPGAEVLIASKDLQGGAVPHDTTVWLLNPLGQGEKGR